jgi:DNA-binding transcriptional regulator YiaG
MGNGLDLIRVRRLFESGAARTIRETSGLSLSEAADESGVHRTSIWRWEAHERRPHGPAALAYLAFLDELSGVKSKEVAHG